MLLPTKLLSTHFKLRRTMGDKQIELQSPYKATKLCSARLREVAAKSTLLRLLKSDQLPPIS